MTQRINSHSCCSSILALWRTHSETHPTTSSAALRGSWPISHTSDPQGHFVEQCHASHPIPHQGGSVGPEIEQCHTSHPLPHQGGSIHCTCGVGRFQESSRLCSLSLRLIVKPPTAAWLCPSNVGPLTANSRPPEKTNHTCSLRLKRNIMQNKHLHN